MHDFFILRGHRAIKWNSLAAVEVAQGINTYMIL